MTGGRNGYGAKLANIFSKKFTVETCDGKRKLRYKQVRRLASSPWWLCCIGAAARVLLIRYGPAHAGFFGRLDLVEMCGAGLCEEIADARMPANGA